MPLSVVNDSYKFFCQDEYLNAVLREKNFIKIWMRYANHPLKHWLYILKKSIIICTFSLTNKTKTSYFSPLFSIYLFVQLLTLAVDFQSTGYCTSYGAYQIHSLMYCLYMIINPWTLKSMKPDSKTLKDN